MNIKDPTKGQAILISITILLLSSACLFFYIYQDAVSFIIHGPTPVPYRTETAVPSDLPEEPPMEEVLLVEDEGTQPDAEHCDAIEYIEISAESQPEEKTNGDGSYSCFYNYIFTNNHPSLDIIISWKHHISTASRPTYWTHPTLPPGGTYNLTLSSNKAANGKWSIIDANNLMAWFGTEACDRFILEYWPDESDPDKFLTSDLERIEITNPCLP
jgi:hypothetical protein